MKRFRSELASMLVFPVTMGLGLGACLLLMRAGQAPSLAALWVAIAGLIAIACLERVLPYRRAWNASHGDVGTDWMHMLVAQLAIPKLAGPLWLAAWVAVAGWATQRWGGELWPHHWPLLLQLGWMLLIAELGRYWVHRLAHHHPLLWRFHAVHHSPKRLYLLNAGRFHPLEKVLFLMPEIIPFVILGTNPETLALYGVFNSLHGLFQHSNIDLRGGVLNYLFSLTELHRWHHSKAIQESDRNYGNNLIVWDLVFGTFYWPRDREVGEIGLLNAGYPEGYCGQLLAPFAKRDLSKPESWEPPSSFEPIPHTRVGSEP